MVLWKAARGAAYPSCPAGNNMQPMPITYTVDREKNVVLVTWRGDVTKDDYRAHLRTMLQDPVALRAGRSLVDLREANVLLSGAELNAVGDLESTARLGGRPWRTAVLVTSHVLTTQYGMFLQTEATDSVFLDRAAALAWLVKE